MQHGLTPICWLKALAHSEARGLLNLLCYFIKHIKARDLYLLSAASKACGLTLRQDEEV